MTDRPLRIAVLNDHELVVAGVARMLEPFASRIQVVDLSAAPLSPERVDLALYDSSRTRAPDRAVGQPMGRGLREVVEATRARRLVVYSWNLDPRLAETAIAQGASGYLAKTLGAAELVDALERIAADEVVVSPPAHEGARERPGGEWTGRRMGLTTRESEIISLITQGLSNQEIAERSFLSINSVKSYIRSSYRKMGVDSRSRAVLWGIANGFRPDPVPEESQPS